MANGANRLSKRWREGELRSLSACRHHSPPVMRRPFKFESLSFRQCSTMCQDFLSILASIFCIPQFIPPVVRKFPTVSVLTPSALTPYSHQIRDCPAACVVLCRSLMRDCARPTMRWQRGSRMLPIALISCRASSTRIDSWPPASTERRSQSIVPASRHVSTGCQFGSRASC